MADHVALHVADLPPRVDEDDVRARVGRVLQNRFLDIGRRNHRALQRHSLEPAARDIIDVLLRGVSIGAFTRAEQIDFAFLIARDLPRELRRRFARLPQMHGHHDASPLRMFRDAIPDRQDRRGRIADDAQRGRPDEQVCDVVSRVRRHDDQVRALCIRRAADRCTRIGSLLHDQSRLHIRVRAAHAFAKRVQLLLFGVVVRRVVQRKAKRIRLRRLRDTDVKDDQLRAGARRDGNRVVKGPLRSCRKVGGDQNAAPGVHRAPTLRPPAIRRPPPA